MSTLNWDVILDEDWPAIDTSAVTPTVDQVALLVPTRTIDSTGVEVGTFTSDTRPTATQAEGLISQALELTLADLPTHLPENFYARVQQAVILQAAILVETAFFREQANANAVEDYEKRYQKILAAIEKVVGGGDSPSTGSGERVDSIMFRSTMAEYQPDYPMPPPRVMPVTPIPLAPDGDGDLGGDTDINVLDGGDA